MELSAEEQKAMKDRRRELGLLSQEENDMEELEELLRKLRDGTITEEELRRLMELQNQYGVQMTDEDIERVREAEDRFNDINESNHSEKEENFAELPPVAVMNNQNSPDKSAEKLRQAEEEERIRKQEEERKRLEEETLRM